MPENKLTNIACLGWGSLIWNPETLPIRGRWFEDGPMLPIEFTRESSDERITLVISEVKYTVRSLWCLMTVSNLKEAKKTLADRERIQKKFIENSVGYWDAKSEESQGRCASIIEEWAKRKNLDGVVWTDLKCGFKKSRDNMPEYEDILNHLKDLPTEKKKAAEEYVRKAPVQIDTEFRRKLQRDLKWLPVT